MNSSVDYKKYIPLDKSWIIRMGILDIIYGRTDKINFLDKQADLSDDLLALRRAAQTWNTDESVDVGESGTLYRLLQFASWKLGLNKKFIKRGTLANREINADPSIVNWPTQELLNLDNKTSQWASAAVLLGSPERLDNPPYKLKLTYDAVEHWKKNQQEVKSWEPRLDKTIQVQVETFLSLLKGIRPQFNPEQAEDYCFARAFDYMDAQQGIKIWPSLLGHESNRIEEMEQVISQIQKDEEVQSKDHRVVQAAVMWGLVNRTPVKIKYPDAVNKSWPQFWQLVNSMK